MGAFTKTSIRTIKSDGRTQQNLAEFKHNTKAAAAAALRRPTLQSSKVGKITAIAVMAASKILARVTTVSVENPISLRAGAR